MDDHTAAYEKLLAASLARALDLLRFAEAKNGALLAFSSAWIVASVNLLFPARAFPPCVALAVACTLPLWGFAAATAVWAFLPQMGRQAQLEESPTQPPSLLYVRSIAQRSARDFRSELEQRIRPHNGSAATDDYLNDLIGQIYALSVIADRKFRLFHWGAGASLMALVILFIPFALILRQLLA